MTVEFGFYSSKVCESGSSVQEYRLVVRSIVRAMWFRKVVTAIEKPMGFVVKEALLTRHSEKPGPLIDGTTYKISSHLRLFKIFHLFCITSVDFYLSKTSLISSLPIILVNPCCLLSSLFVDLF